MSDDEAIQAILAGASIVEAEIEKGLDVLAAGEMGIGNTTPSAAIAANLFPYSKRIKKITPIHPEWIEVVAFASQRPNQKRRKSRLFC